MAKEQWVCPRCGRRLCVANQEHACGVYDLESHFVGKDPIGRAVFDWVCAQSGALGSFDVLPMKTMIGFQARSNYAFLVTKKKGAELSLLLEGAASHPLLRRVDPYGPGKSFHRFRIEGEGDLDEELGLLLRKAYEVNE
jgi:hypothetical protein